MTSPAPMIVKTFGEVARPIMRKWMTANSCIASARCTIEVMKLYRLQAEEIPVAFAFQVSERKYARVSGWSAEERERMRKRAATWTDLQTEEGWNGHLLVLVENKWVMDPSLDQADAPEFGVSIPPEVFTFDTEGRQWDPQRDFEMQLGLILDNGDKAKLTYRRIRDRSYLETEAWKDEGLPVLAIAIAVQMAMQGCRTIQLK